MAGVDCATDSADKLENAYPVTPCSPSCPTTFASRGYRFTMKYRADSGSFNKACTAATTPDSASLGWQDDIAPAYGDVCDGRARSVLRMMCILSAISAHGEGESE